MSYTRWSVYCESTYNDSGLQPWEADVIHNFFPAEGRLVVTSCGGGREAIALCRLGYDILAFDCVPKLVDTCIQSFLDRKLRSTVYLAPPSHVPPEIYSLRFDALIVGWGGYMHIPSGAQRTQFLSELRAVAALGAPLLLSFFTRRRKSNYFRLVYCVARVARFLNNSTLPVELGDTMDGSFDHHFTQDEVVNECASAGFKVVSFKQHPYGHAVAVAV